ncbi:MAG: 50S ribosomal protein L23 [Simkaniaceae bacterium]|nr:50S ribosomal protein L23 [Simkaniaceae bacterium]
MNRRTAYSVVKSRYLTEKSRVLQELSTSESSKSLKKCDAPKVVFKVAKDANKAEIASAVEQIYADKKVKVTSVNTINVKPKKKRMRGQRGRTDAFKKAIVTLSPGDTIEDAI